MSRPIGSDETVIKRAAELSLDEFRAWVADPRISDEQLLDDLCDAIRYEHDGYDRAKHLDGHGYSPDSALVELLDGVDIYRAEREAVAKWVKEFDVKPPFPVGTLVDYQGSTGEITKHDEKHGVSTVFVKALGHVPEGQLGTHGYIIAWEKLKPLAMSKQEVSGEAHPIEPRHGAQTFRK